MDEKAFSITALGMPVKITLKRFPSLVEIHIDAGFAKHKDTVSKDAAIKDLEAALTWLKGE